MFRSLVSRLTRKALLRLSPRLKRPNVIFDHEGRRPYLSRYYLLRGPRTSDGRHPFDEYGRPLGNIVRSEGTSLVLHHFHQSDSTTKLHNHGWTWGLSLVLAGGYAEEKIAPDGRVIRRIVKPFSFNFIRPSEFHRVDLLEEDAWTIFLRGPRLKEWFYKDRATHEKVVWNQHVKMADSAAAAVIAEANA